MVAHTAGLPPRAVRQAHQPAQVEQARQVAAATQGIEVAARARRYAVDGTPIPIATWRLLRRLAEDHGHLVTTTLLGRSGPVVVRTGWTGLDLRRDPTAPGSPAIWLTAVAGGVLDGRVAASSSRTDAHLAHDRAVDDAEQAMTAIDQMTATGSCAVTVSATATEGP